MTKYEYPELFENLDRTINLWAQLKAETGAAGVDGKGVGNQFRNR